MVHRGIIILEKKPLTQKLDRWSDQPEFGGVVAGSNPALASKKAIIRDWCSGRMAASETGGLSSILRSLTNDTV